MIPNYYVILELPNNATEKEIRDAYRRLAKKYHPDVNKSEDAHQKFIEISDAYEHLINNYQVYENETIEYSQEEKDEIEKFQQIIRDKIKKQAQMRYEEFLRKNEAFKKSGMFDFVLFLKIISRFLLIPITLFFLFLPVILSIFFNPFLLFLVLFAWPIGIFLSFFIYQQRKKYFFPDTFYYNYSRLKILFSKTEPTGNPCYYCKGKMANSKPFHLDLYKLKDLKISYEGFRSHTTNYINDVANIEIPRSRKAFIVHTLVTVIKFLSIIGCLFFLSISSITWRFIFGLFLAQILSLFLLFATKTKPIDTYLFTKSFIIRFAIWLLLVIYISKFCFNPFNIFVSDYIYLVLFNILIFECFVMQIIDYIIPKASYTSVFVQHNNILSKTNNGYRAYNDIPVISVIYPFWKWFWG